MVPSDRDVVDAPPILVHRGGRCETCCRLVSPEGDTAPPAPVGPRPPGAVPWRWAGGSWSRRRRGPTRARARARDMQRPAGRGGRGGSCRSRRSRQARRTTTSSRGRRAFGRPIRSGRIVPPERRRTGRDRRSWQPTPSERDWSSTDPLLREPAMPARSRRRPGPPARPDRWGGPSAGRTSWVRPLAAVGAAERGQDLRRLGLPGATRRFDRRRSLSELRRTSSEQTHLAIWHKDGPPATMSWMAGR